MKKILPHEIYIKTLAKKRAATAAVFFNEKGELLVVKPNYREGWLVPGGIIDASESPKQCCLREIREELGLDAKDLKLVGVSSFCHFLSDGTPDDSLHYAFYGGVLDEATIKKITLQKDELTEYSFLPIDKALSLLNARLAKRMRDAIDAIENNTVAYTELT